VIPDGAQATDDRPPFLGSWRIIYAAVILCLFVAIGLLFLFSRAFS
jgi:hypothetical protein